MKSKNAGWGRGTALSLLVAAALFAAALFAGRAASASVDAESLAFARDSVTRAAALCYAVEGAYPEDIDYLAAHYDLALDRERFIYHYEPLGGNLFPEIYVIAKPAG
ncbi:MAG: hypothetical protein VB021_10060 [Oscillospiraceae bacterium]|nr:hypothetical protein [Oscillospiraceae bacterium]